MERKPTTETLVLAHREDTLTSSGATEIVLQAWAPRRPRGVLLFVHGLAEHSGRYGHPIDWFSRQDFACAALDLRGHGRSEGLRVHVDSFTEYLDDVRTARRKLKERFGDLPLVQIGHSMGGLITVLDVLDAPTDLHAAVVSSPALGVPADQEPGFFKRLLAALLLRIAPRTRIPGVDGRWISRDPYVVEAYFADPLVSRKVTPRWYAETRAAIDEAHRRAGELALPLLVMQSGSDRLVDPEATARWVQKAPAKWVTHKVWEGLYHEMFNEPEREQVFTYLEQWLDARLGKGAGTSV